MSPNKGDNIMQPQQEFVNTEVNVVVAKARLDKKYLIDNEAEIVQEKQLSELRGYLHGTLKLYAHLLNTKDTTISNLNAEMGEHKSKAERANLLRYCCIVRCRFDYVESFVHWKPDPSLPSIGKFRYEYSSIDSYTDFDDQKEEKARQRWSYLFQMPSLPQEINNVITKISAHQPDSGSAAELLAKARRKISEIIHDQAYFPDMHEMLSKHTTNDVPVNEVINIVMEDVDTEVGKMTKKVKIKGGSTAGTSGIDNVGTSGIDNVKTDEKYPDAKDYTPPEKKTRTI